MMGRYILFCMICLSRICPGSALVMLELGTKSRVILPYKSQVVRLQAIPFVSCSATKEFVRQVVRLQAIPSIFISNRDKDFKSSFLVTIADEYGWNGLQMNDLTNKFLGC
ncbi:hypothetical protein R6Q59_017522 [Mikania micrantha]